MNIIDEIETVTYYSGDTVKYSFPYPSIEHYFESDVDNTLYTSGETIKFDEPIYKIVVTYKNKVCHSINDEPAIIVYNSYEGHESIRYFMWCTEGLIHREADKPAVVSRWSLFFIRHNVCYNISAKINRNIMRTIESKTHV